MRMTKLLLMVFGLLWLAGCTFESSTVLTDPGAAGDAIAGFPDDGSFKLESFDRAKQAYKYFATAKVEKTPGQGVRYIMTFNDDASMALVVQARKMSTDNYLVRYFQTTAGAKPDLNESGLVFLRYEDSVFYALTGISSQPMLDRIFAGERPLELTTSVVRIQTDHQAERISAYFRDRFTDFPIDQDYARFRVMK